MTDAAPPIEVGDHGELVLTTFTHIAEVVTGHRGSARPWPPRPAS